MPFAPASRVLLTRVALPPRSRQRLRRMLPFALEEKLAIEPEAAHVALGPRIADGVHAVAVVDRTWLAQWLKTLAEAGAAPASLGVETLAVPLEPGCWTVVWRQAGGFVRTGPASGAALDQAPAAAPPAILRLALAEARGEGNAPRKILVRTDVELELDAWSRELGVTCEAGAPWDEALAHEAPTIDLLQGEFEPPGRTRALLPGLRPGFILLGAALALHAIATTAHWAALRHEKSSLQAEMRERFRTAFPQAQAIVDPPLQMRRQLDALRRAAGEARADDFLVLLGRAAPAVNTRVSGISYEQGKLVLDVELDGRPQAEELLQRLQANGSAVALAAVNPKGKRVEARFVFASRRET